MPRFYLDIETAPLEWNPDKPNDLSIISDPTKNKIITIQYQKITFDTGKPVDELHILKEWESSEEEIICKFAQDFFPFDSVHKKINDWHFVPVGNNLNFEWQHLTPKLDKYCKIKFDPNKKPIIDVQPILITINGGFFTGYSKLLGKNGKAKDMAKWYYTRDYDSILDYVIEETERFLDGYQTMCHNLPFLKPIMESKTGTPSDLKELR